MGAAAAWLSGGGPGGTLAEPGTLSRSRTERELAGIEDLLAASDPRLPEDGAIGRYGREQLSRACKRDFALPENPLFDAFDRLEEASRELRLAYDQWLRWTHREALTEVRTSVRRRVRDERRLAYDDLLVELEEALESAGGARLASRVRHEFPCALIDEFQDTDPIQTRIFGRIYGDDPARPRGEEGAARTTPPDRAATGPGEASAWSGAGPAGAPRPGSDDAGGPEEPDGFPPPDSGRAGRSIRAGRRSAGPFIVVGDPKQSIYRFRGADVFAYLAARRTARERLHLVRNWRSVPALVEAVNAVFAGAVPFAIPEIEYRPVAPAGDGGNPLRVASGNGGAPLELWLLPRSHGGGLLAKKDANPIVAGSTANEIVRLLEHGARGEATIEGEPLIGADIAVLVRTREQGRLIADTLREREVRSVEIDDGSVLDTREAEQIERLLWALAEPGREGGMRGALAGDLFGLDARALLAVADDEDGWGEWMERFADWRAHWGSRGIGSMLLRLLEREGGAKHLLAHRDGARRLTNFRHLAELLQAAETRERLAPAELAAWLNHRRAEPDRRDEDLQLRLESDEQLVRILTVHGAKGLEFPVVFCPFAWDARGPRRRAGAVDAMYHLGAADGYREVLDLAPDEGTGDIEWLEEFSESVRLLYVALTRAKYRCVVAWGQVNGAEHAPLAWLLHRSGDGSGEMPEPHPGSKDGARARGPGAAPAMLRLGPASPVAHSRTRARPTRCPGIEDETPSHPGASHETWPNRGDDGASRSPAAPGGGSGAAAPDAGASSQSAFDVENRDAAIAALEEVAERFVALGAPAWTAEIEALARRCPEAISVTLLDADPPPVLAVAPSEDPPPALAAREPARPLPRTRSLTSFTALSAEALSPEGAPGRPPAGRDEAAVDRPDHDQDEVPADASGDEADASGPGAGRERTAFTFPRGPVAGSCLHRIFERLDTAPETGAGKRDLDEICRDALEDFGIDADWQPVARAMVERTRAVGLHEPSGDGPGGGGGRGRDVGSPGDTDPDPKAGTHFRLGDPVRRLVELEFHFPVEGLDRRRLAARLVEHGYPDPFARPGGAGAGEPPPPIHGFMRGYVDLVVEHAGRWYVLDYKSNWLGPEPDDYAPEALAAAMRARGYTLQSLIYLVALHRYLAVRLPGYEYERHVGGTFYLFVRGTDPAAGMRRGVYFDRPSAECLRAIDDCFRQAAGT